MSKRAEGSDFEEDASTEQLDDQGVGGEEGTSKTTPYNWRKTARGEGRLLPTGEGTPGSWCAADKFAAVVDMAALNEAQLPAYCRERAYLGSEVRKCFKHARLRNDQRQLPNQHAGLYLRKLLCITGANIMMSEFIDKVAKMAEMPPPRRVSLRAAKIVSTTQLWRHKLLGGEAPRISETVIGVMTAGQYLDGSKAT